MALVTLQYRNSGWFIVDNRGEIEEIFQYSADLILGEIFPGTHRQTRVVRVSRSPFKSHTYSFNVVNRGSDSTTYKAGFLTFALCNNGLKEYFGCVPSTIYLDHRPVTKK